MSSKEKFPLLPKLRFPEFRKKEGWSIELLGNICEPQQWATISSSELVEEGYPVYGANGFIGYYTHFNHEFETVAVTCRGSTCGEVTLVPPRSYVTGNSMCLDGIDDTNNSYHFVCQALKHRGFRDIISGSAQPQIVGNAIKKIEIALPKRAEQQKIADFLSSLDELIAAQARKVDALKTHKKGLMQQLFPPEGETQPRLRFPEFRNAGEWALPSIQELIDKKFIVGHLDGNHGSLYPRSEEFSDSGIPYISATSFNNGGIDFGRCKFLPEERAAQFKKGIARDGDILFAHNATVGPVAKLTTKCDFVILSTSLTYFRCNRVLLSSDFLQCALVSPAFVDQCARVMSQSTRNQIPITTQRTFSLQLPTLPEQIRIADCLTSLDDLIAAAAQVLETQRTHKKGLMQQLFPSVDAVEV